MLSAMFLPRVSDVLTLDQVEQLAAEYELVLCVPTNFSPRREFSFSAFPPDRIPAGWTRARIAVKSPTFAALETPCAA